MRLIVGLGNPGRLYQNTRHNIGMRVVKKLARESKVKLKNDKGALSKKGKASIANIDFILAHPVTYMNLSGEAVALLIKKNKIKKEDLLVVYDDLDLSLGRLRIRTQGSSGGHKGLQSIIDSIQTKDFTRLRIGIGRSTSKRPVKDFVLSVFRKQEEDLLKATLNEAMDCCRCWLIDGAVKAMNRFN